MTQVVGTFLLLGATGDLAGRLLLPALAELLDGEPDRRGLHLLGAGSEDWDQATWQERVRSSLSSAGASEETASAVLASTHYQRADVTNADDLRQLLAACHGAPALYFALPPAVTLRACTALCEVTLPDGTVLALEKPFGTDEASAADLNRLLTRLVPEDRIFRVDHFLGRSTVLNLLGVRFANRLFETVWNRDHVERVDIVFDEPLTLENRARYYDHAGALRDMIQSHLLQVLALVAMEAPARIDAVELREAKAQALRACRVWQDDPVRSARRARYSQGRIGDRQVPDYTAEPGVDPSRNIETLAEMTVEIDNWRWAGVPFTLRSGKALGEFRKDVTVTFRPSPHVPTGLSGTTEPARLTLSLGPDRMTLELNVNGPGDPLVLDRAALAADLAPGRLSAYGEVLAGLLDSDPMLSVRGDTAEECWRIVEPVLAAYADGEVPMDSYPAGSVGPWRS